MNSKYFIAILIIVLRVDFAQANDQAADAHNKLFEKTKYPSAKQCATCHVEHFKEWSVSPHAYAQISPVFNAMHAATVKRTNGTAGDFCIRCHTPIGMQEGESVFKSNLERDPVANEGVTCITCHRRNEAVGKNSGRFSIKKGDIFKTVYGPEGGSELERVIKSGEYEVNTDPSKEGRNIHTSAEKFDQITTSSYCGTCHDVNSFTGFRLEEAFSEYKAAPAAANGISCQDCHMSKEPGNKDSGYDFKAVALVGGKATKPRKKTNHMFVGPDYSVVHAGIYPHSVEASKLATAKEWIEFDYKAGWGTDEFEDSISGDQKFPERWKDASSRYEARNIIEENLKLLEHAAEQRKILLKNGYKLGEIKIDNDSNSHLKLEVEFKNVTDGHNVPTGFDAERVVFLRVEVKDNDGKMLYASGDLDPNGDLRDLHSEYVKNDKLPQDKELFTLQSRFLVNLIRGGDREEILPINNSVSPLPFIRPPVNATLLNGRPNDSRKHRKSIAPLSSQWTTYNVDSEALKDAKWPVKINVKLIAGMVPVNLVHNISDMGFDYNMSAREVADGVLQGHQTLWEEERIVEESKK